MKTRPAPAALLLLALLWALALACSTTGEENASVATVGPTDTAEQSETPSSSGTPASIPIDENLAPVQLARADIAGRFDRDPRDVVVISLEEHEWPDACLDVKFLNNPDEVCAQVITQGFIVGVQLERNQYYFHTNLDGTILRFAGIEIGAVDETPEATPATLGG